MANNGKKKQNSKIHIQNKKAYFDYVIIKKFEAGVELFGYEVKAVRISKASIIGAHIVVRNGEVFLLNATINHYQEANTPGEYDEHRVRRLLLHKKEILELEKAENTKGLTIIPLMWYNSKRRLKLSIAIAKGKKDYDKREAIKKRDSDRNLHRTLKNK
jgi:SsrA-binding protein